MFLSGSVRVGKSHLRKTIHKAVSKLLQYHGNLPEKSWVLILAPIEVGGGGVGVGGRGKGAVLMLMGQ